MTVLAAVVAPGAGAAGGLGLASLVLFACALVMLGLQRGWRTTLGRFLTAFADLLDGISVARVRPLAPAAAWLRRQVKAVDEALGRAALALMDTASYLFAQAWRTVLWTVSELADLAVTVEQALWAQRHRIADTLLAPLRLFVDLQLRLLRKAVASSRDLTEHLFGRARKGIDYVEKLATKTIPRRIARIGSRVGHLEKTLAGWRAHPGRLVDVLGAAGAVALFGIAIKRLGLRWLRCGNVKKTGNALCGIDTSLLDALLAGALLLTGPVSLVQMAEELGEIIETVNDGVGRVVSEVGS